MLIDILQIENELHICRNAPHLICGIARTRSHIRNFAKAASSAN
jgi:hypothetical protein